jgi:SAM-dependent methyltransferase
MVSDSVAWEEEYQIRGRLWGGGTHNLPELPVLSHVLELGCGNGRTLSAMIRCGWNVTGIDFASRAISLSSEVIHDTANAHIMIADARCPPFKDSTFDAVFALHIIGHLYNQDRGRIPTMVHRILKPGGKLFFSDFSPEDFRFGKGIETEPATFRRGSGTFTHYFTHKEVIELFSDFTPVSIRTHRWPMRVLGNTLVRSEIQAVFTTKDKPDSYSHRIKEDILYAGF